MGYDCTNYKHQQQSEFKLKIIPSTEFLKYLWQASPDARFVQSDGHEERWV